MSLSVETGLAVLAQDAALLRGRRFALLANQASVTSDLQPGWRVLASCGGKLLRLFAPEHGLWGVAQDMEKIEEEWEPALRLPVVSLYGADPSTLAPRPEHLEGLDAVVVDLPDIGCRHYTFGATLAHTMAACEHAGVEVIVCDRPNPLGGVAVEGGPVRPSCRSFVSELLVPIRHGLTLGELALLLRVERHPNLSLSVVTCRGWERRMWWDETGLPWVAPSPNMPSLVTATIYPGACLVEATNLSEGRGTTRPFQMIGAPWLKAEELVHRLERFALPGIAFRVTRFRPSFHKHAGEVCSGVEWHITDRSAFLPCRTGVTFLAAIRALHPEQFRWRHEAYEFVADVPAIDLLTGSSRAREVIEGGGDTEALFKEWGRYCGEFREQRRECLLYPENR